MIWIKSWAIRHKLGLQSLNIDFLLQSNPNNWQKVKFWPKHTNRKKETNRKKDLYREKRTTRSVACSIFTYRTVRTRAIAFSLQGYSAKNEYEFLDLSDVDDIERTRLSSALLHKQQQKQQQKHHQQLQLFDKHERASLIKHDAADAQSRVSQSTTSTDSEYQIVLNDNCNIQSNLSSISSTHNATSGKHLCQLNT